jgi:hypothetical protein
MKTVSIDSLENYLSVLPDSKDDFTLYRGQSQKGDLLPRIARDNPASDTKGTEKEMLSELRRRGAMLMERGLDDWEVLIMAQHFGMKTRLLDWTSNPLAALWFACSNADSTSASYVYLLLPGKKDFLDRAKTPSPFDAPRTLVLKPTLNNPRIVAQAGWFTAHIFSTSAKKWVALNRNNLMTAKLIEVEIPGKLKSNLMLKLDTLGINSFTLFPDVEGLCRHINWMQT